MVDASVQPSMCHVHGTLRILVIAGIGSALIKSHDDIRTYGTLYFHYILGGKKMARPINMGFKLYTLFFYFSIIR